MLETDFIQQHKRDRAALVAELEIAGANFRGNSCNCPFHEDNHPSAGIYENEKGFWLFKCQACGVSADVWDVKAKNESKSTPELLKATRSDLRALQGKMTTKSKQQDKQCKIFPDIESIKAICPGEVEAVFKYTCPDTGKIDMVIIRSKTEQGKTFRQCRPCNGGFEMKAPEKPWPLYNRTRIKNADTIIIVEGEKCVHALADYGFTATTSPAGAGKADYAEWLPLAGKNVILWPDNDEPGGKHIKQVETIIARLEPAPRISIVNPSDLDLEHKEDAFDYIEQCKVAGLDVRLAIQSALQNAKPKGRAAGVIERIEAITSGKYQAMNWPFSVLSRLSNSLIPGTVTLLCGSPGASKSFVLLQALAYWIENNIKACVYELEEDTEFHLMRALAQRAAVSGLTSPEWIHSNPEEAKEQYRANEPFLEMLGRNVWTSPDTQLTLEQLGKWTQERAEQGFRIIAIDPITAAASSAKPWLDDNAFMQSIKGTATAFQCSIIVVTHPSKTMSFPELNQLAGGASYGRFCQSALWLEAHEPKKSKIKTACGTVEDYHNRTMHILKARNGRGQGLGLACEFDSETLSLKEFGIITR